MNNRTTLALWATALKHQNVGFYEQLLKALHDYVDPEHKSLLTAPADSVLRQQGRVSMGVDILETLHTCEKITADSNLASVPPTQRPPPRQVLRP